MSLISPAAQDRMQDWLASEKALKGASENTLKAYQQDVLGFVSFMTTHKGEPQGLKPLARITVTDMRAWMAGERMRGTSARSLARALSAVKTFYRWLAPREGFEPTAVLSTRAPKFTNKLPRPLTEDAAKKVLETVEMQSSEPWVSARDTAVITLLYGCGLRISEALGLLGKDIPLGDVVRIKGKGDKERLVPVLPAARDAVSEYVKQCPFPLEDEHPIFRGKRGGVLNPRIIQKVTEQTRLQLGLPASATRCVTALQHTFYQPAATCAQFKSFWATHRCPQPKPTRLSTTPA